MQVGERRSFCKMSRLLQSPLPETALYQLFLQLGCSGRKGRFSCSCRILYKSLDYDSVQ